MGLLRCDNRRRPSITLDAGYVSITSINISQSSKTLGLYGKKLNCVICIILTLFLISFINLTCLVWVMHKLDWSLFDKSGSNLFRFNKSNRHVEFYKQVTVKESIYTNKIINKAQIDLLIEKQIDISGNQNSILFDDDQILLNTDKFYFKNQSLINFTNFRSFKFNDQIKTRVHLNRFNSQHIHNKHLNLTAINYLTISNVNHTYFYSQNLLLEANRHNRRSILCFKNYPKRTKTSQHNQNISSGSLHFKSDLVFLDLPRLPLLGNNYRSETGIYRICICNTTFLVVHSSAHQACPFC